MQVVRRRPVGYPFRDFDDIFRTFAGVPAESVAESDWLPSVDIHESETEFRLELDVPALPRENISVELKDSVLTVTGERKVEERDGKSHRLERQFGRFSRSFRLPDSADEDSISATCSDGVLAIVIAKREKEVPRQIEVH